MKKCAFVRPKYIEAITVVETDSIAPSRGRVINCITKECTNKIKINGVIKLASGGIYFNNDFNPSGRGLWVCTWINCK